MMLNACSSLFQLLFQLFFGWKMSCTLMQRYSTTAAPLRFSHNGQNSWHTSAFAPDLDESARLVWDQWSHSSAKGDCRKPDQHRQSNVSITEKSFLPVLKKVLVVSEGELIIALQDVTGRACWMSGSPQYSYQKILLTLPAKFQNRWDRIYSRARGFFQNSPWSSTELRFFSTKWFHTQLCLIRPAQTPQCTTRKASSGRQGRYRPTGRLFAATHGESL